MRRFFAICLFILAGGIIGQADEPSLVLNRDAIYEGESVVMTLKVPGGDEGTAVDLSGLPDIRSSLIRKHAENWYNVNVVNGRMQSDSFNGMIYEYTLQPLKKGPYPGGKLRITGQGKTWTLDFPPLQILDIPEQDAARMELKAEPETVLPDETFTVTLSMKVKRLAPPYDEIPPFVPESPPQLMLPFLDEPMEGVEKPDLRTLLNSWISQQRSGFRINGYTVQRNPLDMGSLFEDFGNPFAEQPARFLPPGRPVEEEGERYFEYVLSIPFTARDEGSYTFGPASLKGPILTGVDQSRRGISRELWAVARAVIVRVNTPPEEGQPPSYFGIMGTNLTVDAQLNTGACRVGDPLKITLRIKGPLNWRHARLPDLTPITNLVSLFQVYPSTLQSTKTDDGRDFTVTLRPLQPGTFEIPPLPVSWFDMGTRTYQTAYSAPIPFRVDPSSELTTGTWTPVPTEDVPSHETPLEKTPSALRYELETLPASGFPFPLLLLWTAGPMIMAIVLAIRKLKRIWAGRQNGRRRSTALSRAIEKIRAIPASSDPRQKAGLGCLVMRDYTADVLNRDPGGLTPPDCSRLLEEKGFPRPLIDEFETMMTALFEAAYSPAREQPDLGGLLSRLPDLLRRLDLQLTFIPAQNTVLRLLVLGLATGAGMTASAAEPPANRQFEWEEVRALSMQASAPEEFRNAAVLYNRLVAEGILNGDLFYNMGTCLLLAGDAENAWHSFVRAERYLGRPPDLVRNMELARHAIKDGENSIPTWDRTLLFLHFGVPLTVRLWAAAASFFLSCLLWTLMLSRSKNSVIKFLFSITLLALIASGSSVGVTLFQEAAEEPLVFADSGGAHANP